MILNQIMIKDACLTLIVSSERKKHTMFSFKWTVTLKKASKMLEMSLLRIKQLRFNTEIILGVTASRFPKRVLGGVNEANTCSL